MNVIIISSNHFLRRFLIITGFLYLTGAGPAVSSYDVIVMLGFSGTRIKGTPAYTTISQALATVPKDNKKPFVIFIHKGRYYEKLNIDKANVCLIGENREETIITFAACGETTDANGKPYGTGGCCTLGVTAPDFYAENLTIANGFDYPANEAKNVTDQTKVRKTQAVAFMTGPGSDRTVLRNCSLVGYQDTLFANCGRHYLHSCRISGHVDFIFGAGQAVFNDCEIVSCNRPGKNPTGFITAPSTASKYPYGFLFTNCRLVKENSEVPAGSVRLGRPWHPNAD